MKILHLTGGALVIGSDAVNWLGSLKRKRVFIVSGSNSMIRSGVLDRIESVLPEGTETCRFTGIGKNPTKLEVESGLARMRDFKPDAIIAVGGGSAIDAAKAMLLFYEYPHLNIENVASCALPTDRGNTMFIAIPSTSGTGTEVTHVSVITFPELEYKVAIKTEAIRPDVAILEPSLTMSLPKNIAAETGMDALTHALEAFVNRTGDDFTEALAKSAIEGLLAWLPKSCLEGDPISREKVHNYQCMAGMAFSNAGLGMVHGISHAFGGKYNLPHGLCNAIILPYSMQYNVKDVFVRSQYDKLARPDMPDIIARVAELAKILGIPACIKDAGVPEESFKADFDFLLDNSMKGSTPANPIKMSKEDMAKVLECVYYGKAITF